MAVLRTNRTGSAETFIYTNDTITGNLAAADIDAGDTIPAGLYMAHVNIRLNANVATSTFTVITVGGVDLVLANARAALLGSQAAGTQLSVSGLVDIATAGPQVAVTTANSPQYDIQVVLVRIADSLA